MANAVQDAAPLYSEMGEDPDFGELVDMFVSEMPDRIATLTNSFQAKDWESLSRTAHQLKGASGSYGFGQITSYAARLETSVKSTLPEDEILAALNELVSMCSRMRAGGPQK